ELLAAVAADPEQPLSALPLLTAGERQQLLAEWNDTARDPAPGPWIHERVAEQARRRPAALAVAAGARRVTYGELDRWARRLAGALRRSGVASDVRVGVCLERSPELVAACLGVLQAGGAYVALDPSHPEERLSFQLEDSQVPILLTRRGRLAELAAARGIHCLFPEELERSEPSEPSEPSEDAGLPELPPAVLEPTNLAYVIYTSGSTGRPKGVDLSHGALLNLVAWQDRLLGVRAADRTTLLVGEGYDATILEIWPYLAAGASLHVLPAALRTSPEEILGWMTAEEITASFLPTALAEGLLDLGWGRDGAPRPALRSVLTGGDRLHRYPPASLPFQLVNAYGPTEATVVATAGRVPAGDFPGPAGRAGQTPTLGRPLANVRVHVVEALAGELRQVPVGVPGELLVGGAGLARGYLRRPDLTAERFVPDPFATTTGERLYRTGDLVRWSPAGEIEFLGRIDHQVKIRGQRIELGEIEATLLEHPGLGAAAVVLGGPAGDRRLVAYTVPQGAGSPGVEELRSFLAGKLPAYMVPAVFVALAELPLTANGKLDRRALPDPAASEAFYVAPRSAFEAALAGIWTDVLKSDRVGVHDNFFALGGNSLSATQVLAKIRTSLGVELPMQSLFAAPTIAQHSVAIVEELARRAGQETVATLLSEVEDP
ncbi:MAG TPA: non-ribosomal peptide synthetase, partial [Thermoanaerobaculia bacterium]|nr:non-ribosomal peptide synthetase [Thermoanaerobaculia bacterium]